MTDCSRCAGTNASGPNYWSERIRDIVDFPKPGIVFKDITPLLSDGPDFASALDEMAQPWRTTPLDAVLGIEALGSFWVRHWRANCALVSCRCASRASCLGAR